MLGALSVFGQRPQNISVEKGARTGAEKLFACQDQFAGTISFANFLGQSNDIDPDTIFLCLNDVIDVVHNGDADLTGDPNSATTPGITYAWFSCPPTVSGPNLATIATDPCIFQGPPAPSNDFYVTAGGAANGNIQFVNQGALQNNFNGGAPILIWFAPITIDDFSIKLYENDPVTAENGPCVNMNVGEAFPVVYLNSIELTNFNPNTGTSGCDGSITISGGLSEFDGSQYDVTIELVGNPSVTGTVVGGNRVHGGTVTFQVPAPGLYNVNVEDGKSCGGTALVNMTACTSVTQTIEGANVAATDNICLEITNESGFDNIQSMQYTISWDGSVLQYTGVNNLSPLLPSFNTANFNNVGDSLFVSWFQPIGGTTLPDGTVLYEICFDVVGMDGDCTQLPFIEAGAGIEMVDANGNELGFNGIPGLVCVSASALQVDIVQDSVTCPGGTDGGFTTTVAGGGTPPYNVTWQNTMGGPINGPGVINVDGGAFPATGQAAGTYLVMITDSSMPPLVSVQSIEVLSPPMLNILFSVTLPQCNGDSGSILATLALDTVPVVNPTLNYDFAWSNGDTTPAISGITAGNYTLEVTETATGCTFSNDVFLPQPAPLNVVVQIDSASCSGKEDGVINVSVTGGTPDINGSYNIQIGSTGTVGTNASAMVESGNYSISVADNNGCSFEQNIFMPAIKILAVDAQIENADCNGDCTGKITLTGTTTGGTPAIPYSFAWSGMPNPPPSVDGPTTSVLNNLCTGTYSVIMIDADGCEIDTTLNVGQPTPFDITLVNVENETCQPGNDGSVTVAVTGGVFPYTYQWNVGSSTDSINTGLDAGVYTVLVTDMEGCFDTLSATVTMPTPPSITLLQNDTVDCANSTDGTLLVNFSEGSAPVIDVAWSDGQQQVNAATNLSPGEYFVTVTDNNSCEAIDTALVVAPPPLLEDSIVLRPPVCPGFPGGQITVFVSGGTQPYNFDWSVPNPPLAVLPNVTAGDYTVIVTDANGCAPLPITVTLDDPPAITAIFDNIDSVSCTVSNMVCDGTATATAGYTDGSTGIFNFNWLNSGEFTFNSMSSTATELCAGLQPVIVSDLNCVDTLFVDIPAPPPITPGQETENVSCFGLSDGSISIMPSGGTPPYNIVWAGGQVGPDLTGLPEGSYTAVITDAKNCAFTHNVIITEPEVLELELNNVVTEDIGCAGAADGVIGVVAQGGNVAFGPSTYLWENGIAPTDSDVASSLSAGTYSVTIVDFKGCEDSLTHTIVEPSPIQFSLSEIEPILCFGETTEIGVDSVWGGSVATFQFGVDGDFGNIIGTTANVFAGEHIVSVLDAEHFCQVDTMVNINQPIEVFIDLPEVVSIELGDSLTSLDPVIVSSFPIDTFIWSPPDQLSCTDCKNPRVAATDDQLYTLTIVDINGCVATAQVLVDLDRNRNVYLPNIFSPNGDGINDKFRVYTGAGVTKINFVRLYDRWGELVYENNNPAPSSDGTPGWDGTFKGEEMNPAVFLYLIEVEFLDGRVLLYRGDVSLIR